VELKTWRKENMSMHTTLQETEYCEIGSTSECPCTRVATTRILWGTLVCGPHARVIEVDDDETNWAGAVETLDEWIKLARVWGREDLARSTEDVKALVAREHAKAAEALERAKELAQPTTH
jgi:hypothetical protein